MNMRLIGFNFNKILAERIESIKEPPKVSNSIDIREIKELKSEILKSKEVLLSVKFNYKIEYNPQIAKLEFEGELILSLDSKEEIERVLKEWKNKKLNEEFQIKLFNLILIKSNIKAVSLEEELNLPLHFQMPMLKKGKKE